MKAKVFIMVMAFHIMVVAGLYLLSACSTKDKPAAEIGPSVSQGNGSSRPQFRTPTRPENPEEFAIIEEAPTDTLTPVLDPAFNTGSELVDFTADPIPGDDPNPGEGGGIYVVEAGDSLWAISNRHGVSLDDLLAANALDRNSILQIGQELVIPMESPSVVVPETAAVEDDAPVPEASAEGSDPAEDVAAETTQAYTVVSGDTLSALSRRFNTRVDDIMRASGLTSHNLQVNQVLTIPVNSLSQVAPAPEVTQPSEAAPSVPEVSQPPVVEEGMVIHIVQPGETPSGIARKYGITVAQLMEDNQISDPRRIYAGGELKIRLSEVQPEETPPKPAAVEEPAPPVSLDAPVTPTEFDESVFDDLDDIPEVEVAPQ